MLLSVPVGIVNKREGIQNPTLTAKAGQAYPKKILLLNGLFEKMNLLVFAKGYILSYFSFWVSALIKVWSILLCNSAIIPKHFFEALPTLLPTNDFPRLFSELLDILFVDTTLQLLRFRFQILKFFNLVINCLAVSRL